MAVSATVTRGFTFSESTPITPSNLNNLGSPTVDIDGAIGTLSLSDGSVTNAKVSATAAVDYSKLATLATGQLIVGNAGTPTATTLGGDATIDASGNLTIAASALPAAIPTGAISMWATSSAPDGWLLCDGSTFDASTYADLNTLLGGNTLPNLQGRVPVGVSSSDGDFDLLDTGGSKTHALTESEMPSHTHTIKTYDKDNNVGATGGQPVAANGNASASGSEFTGDSVQSAGSGSAHNIMQPYVALNFIIKT